MQLNGLSNFFIYPGQKLKVPGGGSGGSSSSSTSKSTPSGGYYTPVFYHQNLYTWGQCTWHVFNRRSEIGKVSAHIGGMQIIGTTQQLQMVILLIIIRQ